MKPGRHFPALAWSETSQFMAELRRQEGLAARAPEFTILTACRSGEVLGAKWHEIDLQAAVRTIPAERTGILVAQRQREGRSHREGSGEVSQGVRVVFDANVLIAASPIGSDDCERLLNQVSSGTPPMLCWGLAHAVAPEKRSRRRMAQAVRRPPSSFRPGVAESRLPVL